jgi:Fic family protein
MEADSDLPPVARMAIAHYQFESLHPFADGNGRLGRLLAILQLIKAGLLRAPVINLSPWLEARRQEYLDGLLRVSQTGDFDTWIRFFCDAVSAQAADAVARVDKLLELKELFAGMLRSLRAKGTSLRIADSLIGYPMFTVRAMEIQLGVSYQAANQAVGRLVEAGIVQKASRGNYDRLFSCPSVLRVIET